MKISDLKTGDVFSFKPDGVPALEYRGNGWYGRPWSGGPWHTYDRGQTVYPVTYPPGGRCPKCGAPADRKGCPVQHNTENADFAGGCDWLPECEPTNGASVR